MTHRLDGARRKSPNGQVGSIFEDDAPDQLHDKVLWKTMTALRDILDKYRSHPDFLGTDLVSADQRGAVDDAPLHIAARKGTIEDIVVLVESGATVNLRGDLGNTPLHYAALTGMLDAAAKLLELGADPTIENEFGENPAVVAEQGGHDQVGQLIRRNL